MSLAQQPPRDQLRQGQGRQQREQKSAPSSDWRGVKAAARTVLDLWDKINNDWVFNLAGMLAYNLLMSIVPLLATLIAVFGLFLDNLAPGAQQQLIDGITNAFPASGEVFVEEALKQLARSSGVLLVVSILASAWFGSRLFIVIENCFGIIFRLPSRGFIRQNLVALGMLLLFILLVPVMLIVSAVPSFLSTTVVQQWLGNSGTNVLLLLGGILAGFVIASLLFLAIYIVVPNRPLRVQDAWRGALIAGALLQVYIVAFPFYLTHFLQPDNYGSTVGFAIVVLIFFYYFGMILLLGAEINSFWAGQRQTATALPGILYEVQVRKSIERASGPTAGQPQEDLQADPTGLNFTMTPAAHILKAPDDDTQTGQDQNE